jgi:hypothetical protein
LSLLLADLQAAMHLDQVVETKPAREAIGAAKGLGRKQGQVIDVVRLAIREQRP